MTTYLRTATESATFSLSAKHASLVENDLTFEYIRVLFRHILRDFPPIFGNLSRIFGQVWQQNYSTIFKLWLIIACKIQMLYLGPFPQYLRGNTKINHLCSKKLSAFGRALPQTLWSTLLEAQPQPPRVFPAVCYFLP